MMRMSRRFKIIDILLIAGIFFPLCLAMMLKILTAPSREGIVISGALIYFTLDMPLQSLTITESQINSLLVLFSILFFCCYMTHGISSGAWLRRHHIAEWIVEKTQNMVVGNMGKHFAGFAPFITAILGLSAFSSLIAMLGLYPPTSDLNIVAGWAILVFILITYFKMKCGPVQYIKSFANPVLMAPLNIISEIATPISMAFRHYGNVLSGSVISVLIAAGLQGLSSIVFGSLPGFIGDFPFLQVGLPAVLSIYFDVFSGCLQAYIFAMLTMLYISGGFPLELYEQRKLNKHKSAKITGGI